MQIQELKAGPELDALIAVQIFGWRWIPYPYYDGTIKQYLQAPNGDPPHGDDFYFFDDGTRIADWNFGGWSDTWEGAGLVVECMRFGGWNFACDDMGGNPWWAEFSQAGYQRGAQESATTLPLAICYAALAVQTRAK